MTGEPADPPGAGEWWPLARLAEAGLPSLFARAAAIASASEAVAEQTG